MQSPGDPKEPRQRPMTPADAALRRRQAEALDRGEVPRYSLIGDKRVVPGLYLLRGRPPVAWLG